MEPEAEHPGEEEERNNLDASPDIVLRPRKSRFRDAESPEARIGVNKESSPMPAGVQNHGRRSREEVLQDVVSSCFCLSDFLRHCKLMKLDSIYFCKLKTFSFCRITRNQIFISDRFKDIHQKLNYYF